MERGCEHTIRRAQARSGLHLFRPALRIILTNEPSHKGEREPCRQRSRDARKEFSDDALERIHSVLCTALCGLERALLLGHGHASHDVRSSRRCRPFTSRTRAPHLAFSAGSATSAFDRSNANCLATCSAMTSSIKQVNCDATWCLRCNMVPVFATCSTVTSSIKHVNWPRVEKLLDVRREYRTLSVSASPSLFLPLPVPRSSSLPLPCM